MDTRERALQDLVVSATALALGRVGDGFSDRDLGMAIANVLTEHARRHANEAMKEAYEQITSSDESYAVLLGAAAHKGSEVREAGGPGEVMRTKAAALD